MKPKHNTGNNTNNPRTFCRHGDNAESGKFAFVLVFNDPAYLSHCYDGEDTIRCSLLADRPFNVNYAGLLHGICLDGCKNLPYRNPYVWQENILERDVEMAAIQWIKVWSSKFGVPSNKNRFFLSGETSLFRRRVRGGVLFIT
jgi:hypothetical protein